MHLNRFDLNLLPALDALLNERSVTRAAQRIGYTQPAMSKALQRLREYFGDPLLRRAGQSLVLSPRGLALVEPVRLAVLQLESTLTAHTALDLSSLRRAFRVVIADFLTPLLVPRILARIQAVAPAVQLHIEPVTDASVRRLLNGDVDACYWPYDLSLFGINALPPGLRVKRLGPSPWTCIASREHHDLSNGLTLDRYVQLRHVVPRPSLGADNVAAVWRRLFLVDLNIAASTHSMLDLAPIVAASSLVATVPESLLELIPPQLPVQWCPAPLRLPTPHESLLWHRRYDEEPAHAWLRELFATARVRTSSGGSPARAADEATRLSNDSDRPCTGPVWTRRCTSPARR